jgi:hypothetical protein
MAEGTYAVKPIGVEYICDVCGVGRMMYQKLVFSGHMENRITKFEHKCNHKECNHVQEFDQQYPTVRFVSV